METDPFKVAAQEIRVWNVKAERILQGDELGEVDWDIATHFLQHSVDWARWSWMRQKGLAPKEPETEGREMTNDD